MTDSLRKFGGYDLDLRSGELSRQGRRIRLSPQPAKLLGFLVERAGQLVSREEIREALWGDEIVRDFEQGVNSCVRQIRTALRDRADSPRFIETVPKRGYRFVAPVDVLATHPAIVPPTLEPSAPSPEPSPRPRSIPSHWRWGVFGVAFLVVLVVIGLMVRDDSETDRRTSGLLRVAVMPFEDLTDGADVDEDFARGYFADGMTEEMISRLGRIHPDRLAVIARTSVMAVRDRRLDIAGIGQALEVDYVMEGSVRRIGQRVRVDARLVPVVEPIALWSQSFDRPLGECFAIQNEIASRIAGALSLELFDSGSTVDDKRTTTDEAYDAYLKGRHQWNRFDGEGLETSLRYYQMAIDHDPEFAKAHAAMAESWALMAFYAGTSPSESYPRAIEAAERALSLDPDQPSAHNALGFVRLYFDWDWRRSDESFRRALALDPGYAMAHHWYAGLLSAMELHDEAIAQVLAAMELDPLSLSLRSDLAWYYLYAQRHGEAITEAKRTLEVDPNYSWALWGLFHAQLREGLNGDAVETLRRVEPDVTANLASNDAGQILAEICRLRLDHPENQGKGSPFHRATLNALGGRHDIACLELERAIEARDGWLVFARVDPRFDAIREEASFLKILARVGLDFVQAPIALPGERQGTSR